MFETSRGSLDIKQAIHAAKPEFYRDTVMLRKQRKDPSKSDTNSIFSVVGQL
jgi:hypothetical protein